VEEQRGAVLANGFVSQSVQGRAGRGAGLWARNLTGAGEIVGVAGVSD